LGSVGLLASGGVVGSRALAGEALRVRVWLSERASEHDALGTRVAGYLDAALAEARADVEVRVADRTVSLPAENGRDVLARHWLRLVLEGFATETDVNPTTGVNLLVTDGDPTRQPAGFGRPHVAAVTGGEYVAKMGAVDETPATVTDDGVAASPMVGSYLWLPAERRRRYLGATNACGGAYPTPEPGTERRLDLRYSPCALAALLG